MSTVFSKVNSVPFPFFFVSSFLWFLKWFHYLLPCLFQTFLSDAVVHSKQINLSSISESFFLPLFNTEDLLYMTLGWKCCTVHIYTRLGTRCPWNCFSHKTTKKSVASIIPFYFAERKILCLQRWLLSIFMSQLEVISTLNSFIATWSKGDNSNYISSIQVVLVKIHIILITQEDSKWHDSYQHDRMGHFGIQCFKPRKMVFCSSWTFYHNVLLWKHISLHIQ